MKDRYEGEQGLRLRYEQLKNQRIILGNEDIAKAVVEAGEFFPADLGQEIISQGATTNEVFFIISGKVDLTINGRHMGSREAGRTVGEMSAINPTIVRSATVTAGANTGLIRLSEEDLTRIGDAHPVLWRRLAADLAERLEQRNVDIRPCNEKPVVFVICASEAMLIAETLSFSCRHEADFRIWSDQVFRASHYPLEALEAAFDDADFGLAIASPEDLVRSRKSKALQPRDNVLVELGMSIGKLGRRRSMVLVPKTASVKLPSDFKGLTPIEYEEDADPTKLAQKLSPACHEIRTAIREFGARTNR